MRYAKMTFGLQRTMKGMDGYLFAQVLTFLPLDWKFLGFGQNYDSMSSYMFISSDSFADVIDGYVPPDITAQFYRDWDPKTGITSDRCTGIDFGKALATPATCIHVWKNYDSGFSKYDYCTTCGVKQ